MAILIQHLLCHRFLFFLLFFFFNLNKTLLLLLLLLAVKSIKFLVLCKDDLSIYNCYKLL